MKIVAIHQPNFFPWLGYFNKIVRSDVFVMLDDAQFPKKGGTWTNRVKIFAGMEAKWITLPVDRNYHGVREIRDMQIDSTRIADFKSVFRKTLQLNYSRHPHYESVMELVDGALSYSGNFVSEFNINVIVRILDYLGLPRTHIRLASEMPVEAVATERLIRLTKEVGGDTYMCGGGASGYQEDALFAAQGIALKYQNFIHPEYQQFGRSGFTAGLSILDALFNCSRDEVCEMLYKGD